MTICGIDSSTQRTGMSLFDYESGDLLEIHCIDLHKEQDKERRIDEMILAICGTLDQWNPSVIFIEDTWNKNNIEVTKMLTTIIGSVRYWCLSNDKKFNKILPSQWRSVVGLEKYGNKRQEFKQAAVEYIENNYGINVTDDEAEGILIGEAGVVILSDIE